MLYSLAHTLPFWKVHTCETFAETPVQNLHLTAKNTFLHAEIHIFLKLISNSVHTNAFILFVLNIKCIGNVAFCQNSIFLHKSLKLSNCLVTLTTALAVLTNVICHLHDLSGSSNTPGRHGVSVLCNPRKHNYLEEKYTSRFKEMPVAAGGLGFGGWQGHHGTEGQHWDGVRLVS